MAEHSAKLDQLSEARKNSKEVGIREDLTLSEGETALMLYYFSAGLDAVGFVMHEIEEPTALSDVIRILVR